MPNICCAHLKSQDRSQFLCGEPALDSYLTSQAGQDARRHVATVIVACAASAPACVIGYYTLSTASIPLNDLPDSVRAKMPRYQQIPAVLLGRLAVSTAWQNQKLGRLLLVDALQRAHASDVAWAVFLVHAKNNKIVNFYRKFGFASFASDSLHLWCTRKSIAAQLAS